MAGGRDDGGRSPAAAALLSLPARGCCCCCGRGRLPRGAVCCLRDGKRRKEEAELQVMLTGGGQVVGARAGASVGWLGAGARRPQQKSC